MMGALSLANKLLWSHKKLASALFAAIMFSLFVIIVADYGISGMIAAKYDAEVARTGTHHVTIYNLNKRQINSLNTYPGISIGYTHTAACTYLNGYPDVLCIGSMDDSFEFIGRIRLIAGRYPVNEHEILIEQHLANKLSFGINDVFQLAAAGIIEQYIIVGILDDYSRVWSVWNEGMETSKSLPQIICTDLPKTEHTHAIIHFDGKLTDNHFDGIMNLVDRIGTDNYILNYELFSSQSIEEIENLYFLKWLVIVCLSLAMLLFSYCFIGLYLATLSSTFKIMHQLGKTKWFCGCILAIQFIEIGGLCAILGCIASLCLKKVFYSMSFHGSTLLIVSIIPFITCYIQCLRFILALDNKEAVQTKKTKRYRVSRSIPLMIGWNNIYIASRDYLGAVIALAVSISVFCFGAQYNNELGDAPTYDVDFEIIAPRELISVDINGYEAFLNADECISWDIYDAICSESQLLSVSGELQTYQSKMTLDGNTYNAAFIVCTTQTYSALTKSLPIVLADDQCYDTFSVLLLPGNMHEEVAKSCMITYMQYRGETDNGYEGTLVQRELDFQCAFHCSAFEGISDELLHVTEPTILVSVPYVRSLGLFPGFSQLSIAALPGSDLKLMKENLLNVMAIVPDAEVFSVREYYERNRQLGLLIRKMTLLCSIILTLYTTAITVIMLYTRLLTQKRTIGIYRVIGYSYKDMVRATLFENSVYILSSIIIGIIILAIFSISMNWGLYFVNYTRYWLLISVIITIIGQGAVYCTAKYMFQADIADLIQYNE